MNHCELEHGQVMTGQLLEAGGDPATLFEPPDAAFDDIAAAVGDPVEVEGPLPRLVSARRDDRGNAACMEPGTEPGDAIAFVARDLPWPARSGPNTHSLQHRDRLRGFMAMSGTERRRQW